MPPFKSNAGLVVSLIFAVFLWGGNNAGTKFLVNSWPPIWTGATRFLCAGLLLLAGLRWTDWFGARTELTSDLRRRLWWRGGLSLAAYIILFNYALRYTSVSHVALYLGASPVWALLWEGWPAKHWRSAQRYAAAALALSGVFVLFWPALKLGPANLAGEALGLIASVLWTNYGRQCHALGANLGGAEITAHTMWRAGVWLLPLGLVEVGAAGVPWNWPLAAVQSYCIVAGGAVAFGIWTNALRRWPTSQVLLFSNLIPLSSMAWAHVCLGESITPTFWLAMVLIVAGVALGPAQFRKPRMNVPP